MLNRHKIFLADFLNGIHWKDKNVFLLSNVMAEEPSFGDVIVNKLLLISQFIDFKGMPTHTGLFNTKRLENHVHYMFVFIFMLRDFF